MLSARFRTLAGAGATAFARAHDIDTVKPEAMISPRARRDWQKWNTRLNAASADPARALPAASGPRTDGLHAVQDTVGAVALDTRGGLAAGVSRSVLPWLARRLA
jgi:taspase (threonine aspartase 1)